MNEPLAPAILETSSDRFCTPHGCSTRLSPPPGSTPSTAMRYSTAAMSARHPGRPARCSALGALAGDEDVQELARLANRHLPELKTHDRFGNRIDWVEFHPTWHELMRWPGSTRCIRSPGMHRAAAALCACRAVLPLEPGRARDGLPDRHGLCRPCRLRGRTALAHLGREGARARNTSSAAGRSATRPSVVIGYAMTEKQGGSDLRETQTTARFSHAPTTTGPRPIGTS